MTKQRASELDAIHQKNWDAEHLSDDEWAEKYEPSGATVVWGRWAVTVAALVFIVWGIVEVGKWWAQ
jgi:hypothetical protein